VSLSIPPNTNSVKVLRLKGKGIPDQGKEPAGDLNVRLIVTLPDQSDAELRQFAEGWRANYDPRAKQR
jgi:DnaJ-class molecular chaperone